MRSRTLGVGLRDAGVRGERQDLEVVYNKTYLTGESHNIGLGVASDMTRKIPHYFLKLHVNVSHAKV